MINYNRNIVIFSSIVATSLLWPLSALSQLEEIVVTAQKREQSLQEVPISVDVLSEEILERAQFSDFRNLAQLTPSITFQDGFTPSATNFSIRGIGSYAFTGGIQPSVSVVVDGVPLARAGEFINDLADVGQIDVLRGPQGTLFGANATGGVINVNRKLPTEEFEGEIHAGYSTDDELITRAVISGPLTDNIRGRLAGAYIDRDGHLDNLGVGGDAGGVENKAIMGKLDIDLSERANLLLSFDYSDREHGFHPQIAAIGEVLRGIGDVTGGSRTAALGNGDPVLGQQVLDNPFRINTSKNESENENEIWGISGTLNFDITDTITLKSITAYREFTDQNNPDVDETPADGDNLIMPIISIFTDIGPNHLGATGIPKHARGVTSDYFSQELNLTGKWDNFDWLLGAFYRDYTENQKNNTALLIIDSFNPAFGNGANVGGTATPNDEYVLVNNHLDNTYSVETFAIFGDVTWHVTDRLDVFAGIRWTTEDLDSNINNLTQLAPLTFADIGTRFDSATKTLAVSDLPVFPIDGNPSAVGDSSNDDDFVSFRGGASFNISDTASVYASFNRGFVGIGKNNTYSGTIESFLNPTRADAFEIGLKSDLLDNRLRLNAAIFTQDVRDLQASALIPGTVTTETINAGDLDIQGIEANALFAVNEYITLNGGFVYLDHEIQNLQQTCFIDQLLVGTGCTIDLDGDLVPDAQDLEGKPATNTPDLKFNLGASINVPANDLPFDFFGTLNYSWQDDVQYALNQDDLAAQSSYGILDMAVGITDKNGRYEVQVYGKNITDEFFVSDAFEAFGALGRRVIRVNRNATDYWGILTKINF